MANSDTFEDPNRVLIPFGDCPSDGDSKKRPNSAEVLKWDYREFPDSGWREGLADFWMEEIGAAKPGMSNNDFLEESLYLLSVCLGSDALTLDG